MRFVQRYFLLAAAGAALALSACTDRGDPAGPARPDPGATGLPPAEATVLQAIDCRVQVATLAVRCRNADAPEGGPDYLIVGNQNTYVTLTSTDPNYDAGTGVFTMNVAAWVT